MADFWEIFEKSNSHIKARCAILIASGAMFVPFAGEIIAGWRKSMAKYANVTVARAFNHKSYGQIGNATLEIDDNEWKLDGKSLSRNAIEYLLTFSLQSLQDAYAGSDNLTEATAAFEKKRDAILNGTIGTRVANGATEETTVQRMVVKRVLKAKAKAIPETDAEIDAIYAKNAIVLAPLVAKEMEERKAKRDGKNGLGGIAIDI